MTIYILGKGIGFKRYSDIEELIISLEKTNPDVGSVLLS